MLCCGLLSASAAEPIPVQSVQIAFSPRGDGERIALRLIAQAKQRVDVGMFVFSHDSFAQALCDAAQRRRLQVRLYLDNRMVSAATRPFFERMAAAGVDVQLVRLPAGARFHLKTMVVDSRWVMTGAANWTPQAFGSNVEDLLVLDSPDLAAHYLARMEGMPQIAELEGLHVSTSAGSGRSAGRNRLILPPTTRPGRNVFCAPTARTMRSCREVHAYFLPDPEGLEALLVYLRSAQESIAVGMYLLNHPDIVGVLAEKARVIPVRLLADRIMTDPANAEVLHTLHQAGCEIRLFGDGDRETYHMKTAIVDGSQVWTGSANWTRAAFAQNIEDALCFDSAEIASFYAAYFDAVWQNAVAWTPVDGQVQTDTAGSPRRTTDTRQVQSLPPTGPRTDYDSLTVEPVSAFPVYAQVEYLPDDTYFPALIRSIDTAKQSILGLVYVFSETQSDAPHQTALIQALVRAVNRGVYVYLVLYTPASPVDRLMEMHSNQAERLRSQGVDVRLAHPARPLHAKLFVVDQHRALLGSHNWSEGSLSGARVREASLMLTLPEPEPRLAEYILSRPVIADMRTKESWDTEIARILRLQQRPKAQREELIREWTAEEP